MRSAGTASAGSAVASRHEWPSGECHASYDEPECTRATNPAPATSLTNDTPPVPAGSDARDQFRRSVEYQMPASLPTELSKLDEARKADPSVVKPAILAPVSVACSVHVCPSIDRYSTEAACPAETDVSNATKPPFGRPKMAGAPRKFAAFGRSARIQGDAGADGGAVGVGRTESDADGDAEGDGLGVADGASVTRATRGDVDGD